jgi:phage baseplate assembly protein W
MADFYDIDDSFILDSKGDISLKTNGDAIRQSMHHIIMSQTGVKPGFGTVNKNFGVGTNAFLFAPLTSFTAKILADKIYRQLVYFEKRIEVVLVDVKSNITTFSFEVTITYKVITSSQTQTYRTIINQI